MIEQKIREARDKAAQTSDQALSENDNLHAIFMNGKVTAFEEVLAILAALQPAEGEPKSNPLHWKADKGVIFDNTTGEAIADCRMSVGGIQDFEIERAKYIVQLAHMIAQGYVKLPSEDELSNMLRIIGSDCSYADRADKLYRLLKEGKDE